MKTIFASRSNALRLSTISQDIDLRFWNGDSFEARSPPKQLLAATSFVGKAKKKKVNLVVARAEMIYFNPWLSHEEVWKM